MFKKYSRTEKVFQVWFIIVKILVYKTIKSVKNLAQMLLESGHGNMSFTSFLVLQEWVDTGGVSNAPLVLKGDWLT